MKVTTSNDQAECQAVLRELNIEIVFRPVPPNLVCDGIVHIDSDCFLCGTNDNGRLTLHMLEGVTKTEAWEFYDTMRGESLKHINPRIHICEASKTSPINN